MGDMYPVNKEELDCHLNLIGRFFFSLKHICYLILMGMTASSGPEGFDVNRLIHLFNLPSAQNFYRLNSIILLTHWPFIRLDQYSCLWKTI